MHWIQLKTLGNKNILYWWKLFYNTIIKWFLQRWYLCQGATSQNPHNREMIPMQMYWCVIMRWTSKQDLILIMSLPVHWIILKSQPSGSVPIEKPTIYIVPHAPKGDIHRIMHNHNAQVSHNEIFVEEITQAPCLPCSPWRCFNIVLKYCNFE